MLGAVTTVTTVGDSKTNVMYMDNPLNEPVKTVTTVGRGEGHTTKMAETMAIENAMKSTPKAFMKGLGLKIIKKNVKTSFDKNKNDWRATASIIWGN